MIVLSARWAYVALISIQRVAWQSAQNRTGIGFGVGGGGRVWRGKWGPLVGGIVKKVVVRRRRYGGVMVEEDVEFVN
ncbi:hypothetical protein Tco_1015848 [Tanacetum coccineum]|uniref:Uncharacterized protein n=1 Tax=Tanacetum coccineum TaxID=301880 RepID=A0ABQ5FNA1_9ASTR